MLRYARGNRTSAVGRLRGRRNERERTKNPRQPRQPRRPANPLSFFHVPPSPRPRRFLILPLHQPTPIYFSLCLSLSHSISCCLFEFPACVSLIYTYIDLLYSTLYIRAEMSVCGRRIVYIIGIPYVKC